MKRRPSGKYVEYSSNNSGGGWWLKDKDWQALEDAGWYVWWGQANFCGREQKPAKCRKGVQCRGHRAAESLSELSERCLGAAATRAWLPGATLREAIDSFEKATGQNSSALGCSRCGTPHSFTAYDAKGKFTASYSSEYPDYGDRYDDR